MDHSHYQRWKLSDVVFKSREQLIGFITWYDKNGIYSDGDTEAEGIPKTTLEIARDLVFQALVVSVALPNIGDPVTFDQIVSSLVRTAADQINVDIKNGVVLKKSASFDDLNKRVDANLYGGTEFLMSLYMSESTNQKLLDAINLSQQILDIWLKNGRLHSF